MTKILSNEKAISSIVKHVLTETKSICFQCCTENICDLTYSIETFFQDNDDVYEYLVIQTDKKESELKDLIDWVNENEYAFPIEHAIITCK